MALYEHQASLHVGWVCLNHFRKRDPIVKNVRLACGFLCQIGKGDFIPTTSSRICLWALVHCAMLFQVISFEIKAMVSTWVLYNRFTFTPSPHTHTHTRKDAMHVTRVDFVSIYKLVTCSSMLCSRGPMDTALPS